MNIFVRQRHKKRFSYFILVGNWLKGDIYATNTKPIIEQGSIKIENAYCSSFSIFGTNFRRCSNIQIAPPWELYDKHDTPIEENIVGIPSEA
jgi:hypothetical protein